MSRNCFEPSVERRYTVTTACPARSPRSESLERRGRSGEKDGAVKRDGTAWPQVPHGGRTSIRIGRVLRMKTRHVSGAKTPALMLTQPDWPPGLGLSAPAVWGGVVQGVPPSGRRSPRREVPTTGRGDRRPPGRCVGTRRSLRAACGSGAPCSHARAPACWQTKLERSPHTHTHRTHRTERTPHQGRSPQPTATGMRSHGLVPKHS